tara:strand:+ start:1960 stop:2715 length:756 start_codon:yes stop_codon:yes gene_type:complete
MNFCRLLIFIIFLYSCEAKNINYSDRNIETPNILFSNKGFALVFDESLKKKKIVNKKIDNRSLIIFQKNLKINTNVKITNLLNNKSVLAKVGGNSKYPNFYNSVISGRIYQELDLDKNEPYVEIVTVSTNSTFIAKKTKIYEEEKEVADKAPVEGISIKDLSKNQKKIKKTKDKSEFKYIIKIADFYYKKTAEMMQTRIKDELNINYSKVLKLSNTNYRVYLGPFHNLKSLKNAYDDINPLNFENIEIIKL